MSITNMSKTKRNITQDDLNAAATLKRLWEKLKADDPAWTEQKIAVELGIHQSMFNQLKSGGLTWSTDHVLSKHCRLHLDAGAILEHDLE